MLVEAVFGEVGVSFKHVDDDRAPGDDVALLGFFVEEDKGADNVGT